MTSQDAPVFVRGLSRSGGTLMVTLLDAHPEIAMSYELYPVLLAPVDGVELDLAALAAELEKAPGRRAALKRTPSEMARLFVARAFRGGLEPPELGAILQRHLEDGFGVATDPDRLQLIAACCRAKMTAEGKVRWGLKCNNNFALYAGVWPRARFVNMIRDGRDVLASQIHEMTKERLPDRVGRAWAHTHRLFRRFCEENPEQGLEVYYERLVENPEEEVRRLCEFLEIDYQPEMLRFHRQDLTIYKASHLSMDRIKKPIDNTKVGRWKAEVSETELAAFMSRAESAMREFGYLD